MKSDLLKAERMKRGWTQAKVAEAVGVDTKTVGRWERGKALPYPYYREQLCLLFGKTAQQLGLLSLDEDDLLKSVASLDIQSTTPDSVMQPSFLADPTILQLPEDTTTLVGSGDFLIQDPMQMHVLTKYSVNDQNKSKTRKIISLLTRRTDELRLWIVQTPRGKNGLVKLVLLLSIILTLTVYILLPVVITKLNMRSFLAISTKKDNSKASAVVATNSDPYYPFSSKLALNDPLSDNSRGYDWQTSASARSNDGWACQFIGGAYHAVELLNAYDSCHAASLASNFTFEVQMKIIQGTCGGIVLRDAMGPAHAYSFEVCQNGSYHFMRHNNQASSAPETLISGYSSAIITGLNHSNVIATVANGSTFDLYVNHHKLATVNDSSYSQGLFGVCADAATEVAYTNARMWTLQPSVQITQVVAIDDRVLGTGINQFNYVGHWHYCTNCGSELYDGTNTWSKTPGDYVTFTFTGVQIRFYGVLDRKHGIGAVSIDGGTETMIDCYASRRAGDQLLWTSPLLPAGTHTFKLRLTGKKNPSSSGIDTPVDRVDILS